MSKVKRKSKQLGQILIELGYITPEQLETALEEHRKTPKSLGRVLIDLGMIKESDLVRALAEQVGLEFVDLSDFQIDADRDVAAARGARPPVSGPADRRTRRASPGRDVGPRERLRAGRHPHDHRPRRAAGRRDRRTTSRRRSRSTRAWTRRSRRWPASSTPPARRTKRADLDAARRGRADRQARQRDHDPGRGRPGLRRPYRAARARSCGSASASTAC